MRRTYLSCTERVGIKVTSLWYSRPALSGYVLYSHGKGSIDESTRQSIVEDSVADVEALHHFFWQ